MKLVPALILAGFIALPIVLSRPVNAEWTPVDINAEGSVWYSLASGDDPTVSVGYKCASDGTYCTTFVIYTDIHCGAGVELPMLASIEGAGVIVVRGSCKPTEEGSVIDLLVWDNPNSLSLDKSMIYGSKLTLIVSLASGKVRISRFSLAGSGAAINAVVMAAMQSAPDKVPETEKGQGNYIQPDESGEF